MYNINSYILPVIFADVENIERKYTAQIQIFYLVDFSFFIKYWLLC